MNQKIRQYITKNIDEINNMGGLIDKANMGRKLLIYIASVIWLISIVLYFTTGHIQTLIPINIIFLVMIAEYFLFTKFCSFRYCKFIYFIAFPLNLILIFIFLFTATKSDITAFFILPIIYVFIVLMIHGAVQGLISFFVAICGYFAVFIGNYSSIKSNTEIIIYLILLIFLMPIGAWLHFYLNNPKIKKIIIPQMAVPLIEIKDNLGNCSTGAYNITQHLTAKEHEVVNCILQGLSNKEISAKLYIAENTVKYHIKNIYIKLNVTSKPELVSLFICQSKIGDTKQ